MSDANPKISIEEAQRCIDKAYPLQGYTIQKPAGPSGAWKVIKPTGEVVGSAFNLLAATRQACLPALKAEAAANRKRVEDQTQEFKDFIVFLKEKHAAEFIEWRAEREAGPDPVPPPGDASGAEHDPQRLVSLVP